MVEQRLSGECPGQIPAKLRLPQSNLLRACGGQPKVMGTQDPPDTLAPNSSLGAYCFSRLGNSDRATSLAVSVDSARELLEGKAEVTLDQGGFLLHYLDKVVYPDISPAVLTITAVTICVLNLAFYGVQVWIARRARPSD